jgi:protein translocase SecG subunit
MFIYIYSIIGLLFIVSVLMQNNQSDLGSMMGGGGGEEIVKTRRGFDRFLSNITVILAILLLVGGAYSMFA